MLYLKREIGKTLLGIWQVEETCEELSLVLLHQEWLDLISKVHSTSRKREMLATRVLLKELLGEEKQICYYNSGKPYLSDNSYQISISHTKGYVAIVLDKKNTVALDIEQRTDKIFRVRDRVVSSSDFIDPTNELVHLLLHWSAKEAMFKYLDAEGVDFRSNLHIKDFKPQTEGVFEASESKTDKGQTFDAHYMVNKEFVLVCLLKKAVDL